MKAYVKIFISAIFIGGIFAYFFYKDIKNDVIAITTKKNEISLFQVGVFKNLDNAKNFQSNFENSIIYEDNELYRVIIGLSYHEENKIKLESLFIEKGITYYLKTIKVNEKLIEELENYEVVIIKSNKEEVMESINKNMLNLLKGYFEENST